MTPKQREDFNLMLATLKKIAKDYMSVEELRAECKDQYGLDYESALEMAYDNIQSEAITVIKGIKFIS